MRRWLAWACIGLGVTIAFFHRTSPAVIADHLQAELGISGAALGGLAAAYFYVYAALQLPAGPAVDVLGPRACAAAGGVIAAAGAALLATAGGLGTATLGRAVVGFGSGLVFPSMVRFNATWFSEREFARIAGLSSLFGSVGGLLGAAPFALAVRSFGWRAPVLGVALGALLVAAAAWLWVEDGPTAPEAERPRIDLAVAWAALRDVLRNPRSWPPFFAFFGLYGSQAALVGVWSVPYLMQVHGLDRAAASTGTLAASIGAMVGFPLIGYVSDRTRRRRAPWIAAAAVALLAWMPLMSWPGGRPPLPVVMASFLLIGVCSGGAVCIWSVAKECNRPATAGTSFGLVNAGGFLGVSVLQPAMGWALDRLWAGQAAAGARVYPPTAYQLAFGLGAAAVAVTLFAGLLATETHGRNQAAA